MLGAVVVTTGEAVAVAETTGEVLASCLDYHRSRGWSAFLLTLDRCNDDDYHNDHYDRCPSGSDDWNFECIQRIQ